MLYLDSSALVKRYIKENGTEALNARLAGEERTGQSLFSSNLTFAEVSYVLWREMKERKISAKDFAYAKDQFLDEWASLITSVELSAGVMGYLAEIYERTSLRSGDAIQLASALWVRDLHRLSGRFGPKGRQIVFAVSDVKLAASATTFSLEVFNPEMQPLP